MAKLELDLLCNVARGSGFGGGFGDLHLAHNHSDVKTSQTHRYCFAGLLREAWSLTVPGRDHEVVLGIGLKGWFSIPKLTRSEAHTATHKAHPVSGCPERCSKPIFAPDPLASVPGPSSANNGSESSTPKNWPSNLLSRPCTPFDRVHRRLQMTDLCYHNMHPSYTRKQQRTTVH